MATLSSSPLTTVASAASNPATPKMAAPRKVRYLAGMSSFSGLKAQNGAVASLGLPATADQSFARIVSSLRTSGGASCNAAAEIFKIAAIINGLVLIGVAVGFVLLRMEAFVEESDV